MEERLKGRLESRWCEAGLKLTDLTSILVLNLICDILIFLQVNLHKVKERCHRRCQQCQANITVNKYKECWESLYEGSIGHLYQLL